MFRPGIVCEYTKLTTMMGFALRAFSSPSNMNVNIALETMFHIAAFLQKHMARLFFNTHRRQNDSVLLIVMNKL